VAVVVVVVLFRVAFADMMIVIVVDLVECGGVFFLFAFFFSVTILVGVVVGVDLVVQVVLVLRLVSAAAPPKEKGAIKPTKGGKRS
jgi:hypothetical protein